MGGEDGFLYDKNAGSISMFLYSQFNNLIEVALVFR